MDAANEFFRDAEKVQHKPLTDAQWSDAVECYQRAKLMTDACRTFSNIGVSLLGSSFKKRS